MQTCHVQVEMADFERALSEVKPAFGAASETLEQYRLNGIIDSGEHFRHLQATCRNLVEQASLIHDCVTDTRPSLRLSFEL